MQTHLLLQLSHHRLRRFTHSPCPLVELRLQMFPILLGLIEAADEEDFLFPEFGVLLPEFVLPDPGCSQIVFEFLIFKLAYLNLTLHLMHFGGTDIQPMGQL